MLNRTHLKTFEDFALPLSRRQPAGVYFARVCLWSEAVREGVWSVHELARQRGVIIEDRIANPDERQIDYMTQTLGTDFEPTAAFALAALEKWMPRMSAENRQAFAAALEAQYRELTAKKKPVGVLRNLYIKLMCWLYYRFERLMPLLGGDEPPRVLYVGEAVTSHELTMLRVLSGMGVDILLVEPKGDEPYLKLDPASEFSQLLAPADGKPFPADFSLKALRREMAARVAPGTHGPAAPSNRQGAPGVPASPSRPAGPAYPNRPGTPADPAPQGNPARRIQTGASPAPAAPNPAPQAPNPASGQPRRIQVAPHPQAQPAGQRPALHIQTQPRRPEPAQVPGRTVGGPAPGGRQIVPERYFQAPSRGVCTNAWMKEADFEQILTPVVHRGDDPGLFYNAFIRLYGAKDRLTYVSELYRFYQKLTNARRTVVAVDGPMPDPDPEELSRIRRRGSYRSAEELIVDLAGNLPAHASVELQRQMQRAFVQVMEDAAKAQPDPRRLLNTAVILLCRIQRWGGELFRGWRETDIPVFILMGGCQSEGEALFARWLSRLPADVLLPVPNLDRPCLLKDEALLELRGEETLTVARFPRDDSALRMRTAAAHAEGDLDALLYSDSGFYRDKQFAKGNAITLRTTYDELFLLWDQELKYRTGFSTEGGVVNMPVIFAKISGVEKGDMLPYWQRMKTLVGRDTLYFDQLPAFAGAGGYDALAVKCLRNGHIRRDVVKADRRYPFALLREELQEHIFDKLQLMLDRRMIRGTYANGTEYAVISAVLGLSKEALRLLQAFDFTKRNPKIVCVSTREHTAELTDAILLTFFNLIGFDVALFVPTGYQTIERFMDDNLPVEHQIGPYVYDQTVPNLEALPAPKGRSWINKLLRRD